MTMKTIKQLTFLVAIPLGLAGCDNIYTDMGYGDTAQARQWTAWHAKDMAVSGLGTKTCDNWNYAMDTSTPPNGEPDFGCSNAYNLAKMAERKGDLQEGRTLSYTDSTRSDLMTQYYREDKTKQLLKMEKILAQ